jgi:TfoX N-terminal domain
MAVTDRFVTFVLEQLDPLGPIASKRMFGGVGLCAGDLFFALIAGDVLGSSHEFISPRRVHRPLRKLAMHQTASTAWRATAGHIRTPTSLTPAPALARTATATLLYSSIAATNPRRARLGPSSRASQQAPPNESSAAPATRATTSAAGASSDVPSKKGTTSAGDNSSIKPIGVSTNAVTISSFLATISNTNNR